MFSRRVRRDHEPEATRLIEKFLAWQRGELDQGQFTQWLHARDRRMALEVDSSSLNQAIMEVLVREFPNARFVLTIRDCYSWCNSMIYHTIRFKADLHPLWKAMGRWRMRPEDFQHAPQEELLRALEVAPLACYFRYWSRHNADVLAQVPQDRLLVVRTDETEKRAFEIADFAGLPRRVVRLHRTHAYKNPAKQELLRKIDRDFVESKVEQHCRPLMARFFAEIKSLDDVRL